MREVTAQDLERCQFRIGPETRQRFFQQGLVCVGQNKRGTEPVFALDRANRQDPNQAFGSFAKEEAAYLQATFGQLSQPERCLLANAGKRRCRPFDFAAASRARPSQLCCRFDRCQTRYAPATNGDTQSRET